MFRLNQVFIIGAISLLALVGCNNAQQSATQPSSTANPASETTSTSAGKPDFKGLLGVVSKTQTAVQAGNFAKAKEEFDKFEGFWSKVEDGVKAKSATTYKAIEDNADEIKASLKASAPNKQKLLGSLQSLNKQINSVTKS